MTGFACIVAVSCILAATGTVVLVRRVLLLVRGTRATGRFVRRETSGIRGSHFHPVVRFTAHDDREYEFVAAPDSTARKARSTYRVVYPREAPGKAMVLSFAAFWAAPLALLVLALGAAIAAYRAYPG